MSLWYGQVVVCRPGLARARCVLGSCVGRSEGFPEVWMLESMLSPPGVVGVVGVGGDGVQGRRG